MREKVHCFKFPLRFLRFLSTHHNLDCEASIGTRHFNLSNGVLRLGNGAVVAKSCLEDPIWLPSP